MKTEIHPKYFAKAKITCACGNVLEVGATEEEIRTDICSSCHPFYTGTEKVIDTAGRIEKFKSRQTKKVSGLKSKAAKKSEKRAKKESKTTATKKVAKKATSKKKEVAESEK